MIVTRHAIEINSTVNDAFILISNAGEWSRIFPPCKSSRIVDTYGNHQIVEITAEANNEVFTWVSHRRLYKEAHVIDFIQEKPSPLLKKMSGSWRVDKCDRGVVLSIEHRFSLLDSVKGIIEGVNTQEDALKFMHKTIAKNSNAELLSIKDILEKGIPQSTNDFEFEESIVIPVSKDKAYDLLKNVRLWPSLLPHCRDIHVNYDDNCNQEFVMKVDVKGEVENIRSIRKCTLNKIEYFQPEPPPVLNEHRGYWTVVGNDSESKITSWHAIKINQGKASQLLKTETVKQSFDIIRQAINNNSMQTMQAIKLYLLGE
jgi:aromatase